MNKALDHTFLLRILNGGKFLPLSLSNTHSIYLSPFFFKFAMFLPPLDLPLLLQRFFLFFPPLSPSSSSPLLFFFFLLTLTSCLFFFLTIPTSFVCLFFFFSFWLFPPLKTWRGNFGCAGHSVPHYIYFVYLFFFCDFLFFLYFF